MTTNHEDRLDSALIRPGRVDMKQVFGHATDAQIKEMFLRFYEGRTAEAEEFLKRVRSARIDVSTAMLQGMFVLNKGQPEKSVAMASILT